MPNASRRLVLPVLSAGLLVFSAGAVNGQQTASPTAAESPVTLTQEERARYVGVYDLATPEGPLEIRIYEEGDRLMGLPENDHEPSPLRPLGEHRFRPDVMQEAVITFRVENGRAINFAIRFPDERGTMLASRRP